MEDSGGCRLASAWYRDPDGECKGGQARLPEPPFQLLLVLIDVGLHVPRRNERQGDLQDNVAGIGGLVNLDANFVIRARLAVINQFEDNGVTISAVISTGTHANNSVDRRCGRVRRSCKTAIRRIE